MKFKITYLSQWDIAHVKTISAESQEEADEKAAAYVKGTEYAYMIPSHGHSKIISVKQKDKPLTVNDAINAMSVEETPELKTYLDLLLYNMMHDKEIVATIMIEYQEESDMYWTRNVVGDRMEKFSWYADAVKSQLEYHASPYNGEQEGAE